MTQYTDIISYMTKHGGITQKQANFIGVGRLSARIHELRIFGIGIDTISVPFISKHGRKSHIAKYVFHSAESEKYALERFVAAA
jgi:hypothetical protein